MKKLFTTLAMATLLICALATTAFAEEISVSVGPGDSDYIYFDTSTGEVVGAYYWGITTANIPSTINGVAVTSIGREAFLSSGSLTSVTIPDSVTSIGYRAFAGCESLASVTMPSSMPDIGREAFSDTPWWDAMDDEFVIIDHTLIKYNGSGGAVTIPSSVTTIGDYVFYGCSSLTSVTIPSSVISIGDGAFGYCTGLTSITIPSSVTSIGSAMFYGCESLASVTIPSSATIIGEGMFYDCKSLTSITLPSSVTTIGDWMFSGCESLTSITIPNSVDSIGYLAFGLCESLASVTIPSSVIAIDTSAFFKCSSLGDVYYGGSQSQWDAIEMSGNGDFRDNLTDATIHYNSTMADETTTTAATTATATLSSTNLQVNGQAVAVQAYMINDNNYIKLRDLATMINGTGKNFEVTWNETLESIEMKSSSSYTSVGGEMATDGAQSVTATLTTSPIYLDGVLVELTAYNINDNNYFKLRDVMELFDVGVGYDDATRTASLDTSVGYTG